MAKVLSIDPSLAGTGWVVLDIQPNSSMIIMSGMIKTEPDRRRARKSEQNFGRAEHIGHFLSDIVRDQEIKLVTMELPAGSQNAVAATCVGLAVGVIAGLCGAFSLPYASVTPIGLKKAVAGSGDASKQQVQDVAEEHFPGCFDNITTKVVREAVGDAIGAYLACKEDSIVRAVLTS